MTARSPYYRVSVPEERPVLSGLGHRALLACGKPAGIDIRKVVGQGECEFSCTRKFLADSVDHRALTEAGLRLVKHNWRLLSIPKSSRTSRYCWRCMSRDT